MSSDAPATLDRTAYDRWLWERGIDNVAAAKRLECHAITVSRHRLPFGHPDRRIPDEAMIRKIVVWTEGAVTAPDFYPPHLVGDPENLKRARSM